MWLAQVSRYQIVTSLPCGNTLLCDKVTISPQDTRSGGPYRKEGAVVTELRLRAEALAKIRKWVGLSTDAALAERMGTDAGNLSRVLRGKQQPGPKFIAALCTALDAELGDLFEVVEKDAA